MIIQNQLRFIIIYGLLLLVLTFVDNILMASSLDSIVKRQSTFTLYTFVSITVVNLAGQGLITYYVRNIQASFKKETKFTSTFELLLITAIFINIVLFSQLIFQIIDHKSFDFWIYKLIIFLSYSFSLINIGFLIRHFVSWYKMNKNTTMLLYSLALSLYVINLGFNILALNAQFDGRPEKISFLTNPWDVTSIRVSLFTDFYKWSSTASFTITWLATSLLMYHYSRKLGKKKFWLLVSLPMVYYLGNIDFIRVAAFNYFTSLNPYSIWIVQILLGGVKQVGGFFFAFAFIVLSRNIESRRLKFYLVISAVGMMLLFSSNQISLIQIIPYPPFGLNTASLLTMASYLLLTGLYNLAYSIARDTKLLESARIAVKEKSSRFLYDIASPQWRKDIENTVTKIMSDRSIDEYENVPTSLTEDEIKLYVNDVIKEFRQSHKDK
jgi:hypothetical protein